MDLKKCNGCRFGKDENCIAYEVCKIIEFSRDSEKVKELLSGQNNAVAEWALKQA